MSVSTKKSVTSSHVSDSALFFTQTLERLESVMEMDCPMAVRLMKIVIRSVNSCHSLNGSTLTLCSCISSRQDTERLSC